MSKSTLIAATTKGVITKVKMTKVVSQVTAVMVNQGSGGGVTSFNARTGAVSLTSGDVTTALGYTPATTSVGGDLSGTLPNPTVVKINGVSLSGLATGLLKNTVTTGIPSIAIPGTDYQVPINLTTTGTSGAATFAGGTLNIPQYSSANQYLTLNTQTANYVLQLSDAASVLVEMNVVGANTVTVPPNSSVAFVLGTIIQISQYGTGPTSLVAGVGVTIRSSSGLLSIPSQYSPVFLEKRGTDEWYLWNGAPSVALPLTLTANSTGFSIAGGSSVSKTLTVTDNATLSGTNTGDQTLTGLAYWNTGASTTLTAMAPIIESTSFWTKFQLDGMGTTLTGAPGVWLVNTTAAAAGAQQVSPILLFRANGWKTTAAAASQTTDWMLWANPIQGTTNPTSEFKISFNINAGGIVDVFKIGSTGYAQVTGADTADATVSFQVANSSTHAILTAWNSGRVTVNGALNMFASNTDASTTPLDGGRSWRFNNANGNITNQSIYAFQSGNQAPTANALFGISLYCGFTPSSGTATFTGLNLNYQINQTSTASGAVTGIDYNPTLTAVLGTHYGILIRPVTLNSFGAGATPTAIVHVGSGTTTIAPFKLSSGTNLTTAVAGVLEYDGTTIFFTRSGTTRESVLTGIANVVSPTSPNRTIQVVIAGTIYYLAAKTTND